MATILLNTATGSDANDGTTLPVKSLFRAVWQAGSGDVIECTSTPGNPTRGYVSVPAGVTIKAADGAEWWHSGVMDISHGAIGEDAEKRGVFTANYTDWTAGGAVNGTPAIVGTGQLFGAGCLELATGEWIRKTAYISYDNLVANMRKCRYRIGYKMASGATNLRMRIETTTENGRFAFDFSDETWKSTEAPVSFTETDVYDTEGNLANSTDWAEVVTPWFGPDNSFVGTNASSGQNHYISGSDGTCYVQYIVMEVQTNWAETGTATVYSANVNKSIGLLPTVTGRTSSYHGTAKVSGIYYATDAADWTTFRISEGDDTTTPSQDLTSFYNDTTKKAMFKIPSGASISDYKLYIAFGQTALDFASVAAPVVTDCNVICSQIPARLTGTSTVTLNNFNEYVSLREVAVEDTATLTWNTGRSEQPIAPPIDKYCGGGLLVGENASDAIATATANGVLVKYAGDDAFQCIGAGDLTINGCASIGARGYAIEQNGTDSPVLVCNGFSTDGSFRDQSASNTTTTITNSAFAGVELGGANRDTSTYTISDTVHIAAANVGITGGATTTASDQWASANLSATLGYTSATDLTPTTDSDLYMAGTKWWTGARPTSASGEPYPDFDLDAGGIQSTHGPFHPSNL